MPVDFCGLNNEIRPKDHIAILRPILPSRYSPLQENGDGLQSVYLAEIPKAFAEALIGLIGQAYWDAYATIAAFQNPPMSWINKIRSAIAQSSDRHSGTRL